MTAVDERYGDLIEAIRTGLREDIRQIVLTEADHVLKDVEWRFHQALERENTALRPWMTRKITAEDFDVPRHMLTGYTITNNSPVAGSIAWASLHIVYNGTDYTITDGNTASKYVWWAMATSTSVLQNSNTKPTLTKDDIMVFTNGVSSAAGIAVVAATDGYGSLPGVVADNAVDSGAIQGTAVTAAKMAANSITTANAALASGVINASGLFGTGVVSSTALAAGSVTAPKLTTLQHILY